MIQDKGRRIFLGAIIAALVYALFHFFGVTDVGYGRTLATRSIFIWLFRWWRPHSVTGNDMPFGWIAPIVTLWMIWHARGELARAEKKPAWTGLALIALALAMHWLGARTEQTRISLGALVLLLWSIPFHIAGWRVARILLIPCAFLFLAVPLDFLDALTTKIRIISSASAVDLLRGLGIETLRIDQINVVPANETEAREFVPCLLAGGLRSAVCIFAAVIVLAWTRQRGTLRQLALVFSSFLIFGASDVLFNVVSLVAFFAGGPVAALVVATQVFYYLIAAALLFASHRLVKHKWRPQSIVQC